jgi:hypothetical protein
MRNHQKQYFSYLSMIVFKNSVSQSIESIAKIIINAKCMKETFPETFKE